MQIEKNVTLSLKSNFGCSVVAHAEALAICHLTMEWCRSIQRAVSYT